MKRQVGEVVIPMIVFIKGGMRIPIGTVAKDYLRAHRLGNVNALNEKMGLGFTHHDVYWVYNLHHLKRQGYYLKTRYPEVRLISCLPESNNGMDKDFLIMSGEWHDGLPCPTREGKSSGVLGLGLSFENFLLFP